MKAIIYRLKEYLLKVIGMEAKISRCEFLRNQLAAYLVNSHDFYQMELGEHALLLVLYHGEDVQAPSVIKSKFAVIRERPLNNPILVSVELSHTGS